MSEFVPLTKTRRLFKPGNSYVLSIPPEILDLLRWTLQDDLTLAVDVVGRRLQIELAPVPVDHPKKRRRASRNRKRLGVFAERKP